MRTDKHANGEVRYGDCMNEENGLPTLEDKSIDLCLTDPPYDVMFRGKQGFENKPNKQYYIDNKEDYLGWCREWFTELERVCKGIIFTPGSIHLFDWIIYKKPPYLPKYWYKENGCGSRLVEVFLLYGSIKRNNRLREMIPMSFKVSETSKQYVHPCPKYFPIWYYILNKLKPINVLDPFLGSGTTAEVATKLGIPWLGYELNEVYSQDIDKRLKGCKKEPTQMTLEGLL